jgi:hypothetical protein
MSKRPPTDAYKTNIMKIKVEIIFYVTILSIFNNHNNIFVILYMTRKKI